MGPEGGAGRGGVRIEPGPTRVAIPGHRGSLPPTCSALRDGPLGINLGTSGYDSAVRWVKGKLDG